MSRPKLVKEYHDGELTVYCDPLGKWHWSITYASKRKRLVSGVDYDTADETARAAHVVLDSRNAIPAVDERVFITSERIWSTAPQETSL